MKENALDIGTPPLTRGKGTKYEKIENVSPWDTSVRGVGSPVVYIITFDGINVNLPTIFERYARCTYGGALFAFRGRA